MTKDKPARDEGAVTVKACDAPTILQHAVDVIPRSHYGDQRFLWVQKATLPNNTGVQSHGRSNRVRECTDQGNTWCA
jgi:hypothetical protein